MTTKNEGTENPFDPTRLTHKQATNRLKDIKDELERLDGKAELTMEDERAWSEMVSEAEVLDQHIRNLEREADRAKLTKIIGRERVRGAASGHASFEDGVPGSERGSRDDYDVDFLLNPDSVEDKRFRNPWDLSEVRTYGKDPAAVNQEITARAIAAIEKMSGANDKIREAGTNIVEQFDDSKARIARTVLATSSPEYLRAWSKLARGKGHLVTPEEQAAVSRAMSLTDSTGGYLVPFQLDPTVIITANGSLNQIRQIARSVVATGDVWNGVSAGQVNWSWDAEAAEVSDDTPTFAQPTITVHKAAGFVPISIEALEDEANVTQEVARLLAFGKDTLEAAAFISGTGSGQPFGVVTALNGTASNVTGPGAAASAAFTADSVYALDNALPARYRGNSSWLAHRVYYNKIRAFGTSGGSDMWERIGADRPGLLLGRPAYEAENMQSATPAQGHDVLIYGDFQNYVIADRVGMTVEFIPHLFGSTNRFPTGQRGWYAYYRVGADSVNDGAFRMLQLP